MAERIKVRIPGSTSNLGSGFDTISAALGIYLDISAEVVSEGELVWPDGFNLPPEENMILQALEAACSHLGFKRPGLRFGITNEIPLKRGLGSSAAAIIGGIKLAEGLSGKSLSRDAVFEIAYPLENHPDNLAASCLGGWALSLVSEGRMRAESLESKLNVKYVVVIPEYTVSTREARDILPGSYSLGDAVYNLQRVALMVHAVMEGRSDLLRESSGDRLHQEFRASLVPGMSQILQQEFSERFYPDGLLSVTVSGSGSAMLALVEDDGNPETVGREISEIFGANGVEARWRVLELDRKGARYESI